MLGRFRQRLDDVRALTLLMRSAEGIARETDEGPPGAEHFLLAALEHPDGSARRVLDRFGVTPETARAAVERQYVDALRSVGLDDGRSTVNGSRHNGGTACAAPPTTPYGARASGQALLRHMADRQRQHRFKSARVLDAVAGTEHGVAARTLRVLEIDLDALRAAIVDEIGRGPCVDVDPAGTARKF